MSGYRYSFSSGTSSELYALMKSCSDIGLFRKIQSVYLRAKYGYLPAKISEITGLSTSHITHIHSEYKKSGKDSLVFGKKGGRNHFYLSHDEEATFLESFKKEASDGGIVEIRKIIKAYEKHIDKKVHKSMIYKLLHRHGWRKIFPRPNHPNQNVEAMEAFKKTSPSWSPSRRKRHRLRDLSCK